MDEINIIFVYLRSWLDKYLFHKTALGMSFFDTNYLKSARIILLPTVCLFLNTFENSIFPQIRKRPICSKLFRLEENHHFDSEDNTMEIIHYISKEGIRNSTLTGYAGAKLTVTALTPGEIRLVWCGHHKTFFYILEILLKWK